MSNPNINPDLISYGWPNSRWSLVGIGDYSKLEWQSEDPKPTEQEINDKAPLYANYLLLQEFKEYRDLKLLVEITTELSGSRTVILKNDDRTKVALADKMTTLLNKTDIGIMAFEARNGWFSFDYEDYQELRLSLDLFTQTCFDAQRYIEENHAMNPYTDDSWKQEFDNLIGG